jgi:hypothetical protein
LEQSLRMSEATTASTGTLVLRISVGILLLPAVVRLASAPVARGSPPPLPCAALVDRKRASGWRTSGGLERGRPTHTYGQRREGGTWA